MKPEVKPNPRNRVERVASEMPLIPPWIFWMATFILIPLTLSAPNTPDTSLTTSIFAPVSTPAHSIMRLLVVVFSLIVCAVVRFRRRPQDDGKEPAQVYGSNPVEMAWTVVPVIIVVVLTLTTARIIHEIQDAPKPPGALDVQVIGHQFWWEIRYPKFGVVTANEMHVPVSLKEHPTPTFLDLRS